MKQFWAHFAVPEKIVVGYINRIIHAASDQTYLILVMLLSIVHCSSQNVIVVLLITHSMPSLLVKLVSVPSV